MNKPVSTALLFAIQEQKKEGREVLTIVFSTGGYIAYVSEAVSLETIPDGLYFNLRTIDGIEVEICPALNCAFALLCKEGL